jgi:hypothetical protein
MKLLLLISVLFLQTFSLFGQITINESDAQNAFAPGKSVDIYTPGNLAPRSVNIGAPNTTGAVWDFTGWSDLTLQQRTVFIQPNQSPFSSHYPSTTHANYQYLLSDSAASISYLHMEVTSGNAFNLGVAMPGSPPLYIDYIPPVPAMQFPCTYGTTWSYTSDTTELVPGMPSVSEHTWIVDGYGTLKLPTGDYPAIRCLTIVITHTFAMGTVITDTTAMYNFWTQDLNRFASVTLANANEAGNSTVFGVPIYSIPLGTTDIADGSIEPESFSLSQNYPNPFNPSTIIRFQLSEAGNISLKVFDALGKMIHELAEGYYSQGSYEVSFDAANLPSGIYFYRLESAEGSLTKQMILIK